MRVCHVQVRITFSTEAHGHFTRSTVSTVSNSIACCDRRRRDGRARFIAADQAATAAPKEKGPVKGAFSSRVLFNIPARLEPVSRRSMNTARAASYTFIYGNCLSLRSSSQRDATGTSELETEACRGRCHKRSGGRKWLSFLKLSAVGGAWRGARGGRGAGRGNRI